MNDTSISRRSFLARAVAGTAGLAVVEGSALGAVARAVGAGPAALDWSLIGRRGPRPPSLRDHSLVLDRKGGALYLFGGRGPSGDASNALWRFRLRSGDWKRISPEGAEPDPRFSHNAAWDARRRRLVLYMGQRTDGSFLSDVWAFDPEGPRWRRLGANSPKRPAVRYGAGGAYDGEHDRLLLTHGFTFKGRFDDTWAFDLESERWRRIATAGPVPLERCLLRAGWDRRSGRLLLFGGQSNPEPWRDDFWTLDVAGGRWKKRGLDPRPGPRNFYAATFDPSSRVWHLWGGSTPDGAADDLWTYDAARNRWFRRSQPARRPTARSGHDVVASGTRLWLYGGSNGGDELWRLELTPKP